MIMKSLDTELMLDGRSVPGRNRMRVFTVAEVDGERLFLMGGDDRLSGWANQADVVRLQDAIAYFTGVLAHNPASPEIYRLRGLVKLKLSQREAAIEDLNSAIRERPTFAPAYIDRAEAWIAQSNCESAIADLNEALRLNPRSAEAHLLRGHVYQTTQKPELAVKEYTDAIHLDPSDGVAYCFRAITFATLSQEDKSLADYDEGIRLSPDLVWAHHGSGCIWIRRQDFDRAIKDFEKVVKLDPASILGYAMRGTAWQGKGQHDRALSDFGEVLRLGPDWAIGYCMRGNAYYAKGDRARALGDYEEALRLDPECVLAYSLRGMSRSVKGDLDGALSDLFEALRRAPDFYWARLFGAYVYEEKKEYESALLELDRTGPHPSIDDCVASEKAWIRATCPRDAFRDGRRALDLAKGLYGRSAKGGRPDQMSKVAASTLMAVAHAENGDFKSAIDHQRTAIDLYKKVAAKDALLTRLKSQAWLRGLLRSFEGGRPYREQESDLKDETIRRLRRIDAASVFSSGAIPFLAVERP